MRWILILAGTLPALLGCRPEDQRAAHDAVPQQQTTTPYRPYFEWRPEHVPSGGTFARTTDAAHPVIAFDELCRAFPIDVLERAGCRLDGSELSSPADLAVVEQVRARARAAGHDLGPATPVDVFLWASGEPPRPFLTKVGGVPHRERQKPWPITTGGQPMTFVAQFCFADSTDLFDLELPGEVLLVFFGEESPWPLPGEPTPIHVEWSRQQLEEPATAADVPATPFTFPILHGVRHRTAQYPDAFFETDVFEQLGYHGSYHFAITQATTIGTETWFIQNDPRKRGERLICALSSTMPHPVWPLVDRAETSRPEEVGIMFGDLGCYYFLLDRRGRVRVQFDCY